MNNQYVAAQQQSPYGSQPVGGYALQNPQQQYQQKMMPPTPQPTGYPGPQPAQQFMPPPMSPPQTNNAPPQSQWMPVQPQNPTGPSMPPPMTQQSPQQGPQRTPMPPRPGMTYPAPPSSANQLANQMSSMTINGHQQQQQQQQPPQPQPIGPPHPGSIPPSQRYPPMNGFPDPANGPVNRAPGAMPPASQMNQRYPPMPETRTDGMSGGYPGSPPMPGMQQPASGGMYPPSKPGGYPPQPGGGYPGAGGYPGTGYPAQGAPPAQEPQRRLDPDSMPSPMQVMEDDQKNKAGIFYTNQPGQMPPLVTTDFVVQDQGNASPRFIRSTLYTVPTTADIMKQISIPFGLIISPMADVLEEEQPPPLVDFGEMGPVRCIRCKAYMCPNMQFFDGGRRFHCLLCKAATDVPSEYFQHLDHTGLRVDRFERAELILGAYDMVATKEYCRESQPPKPPALIFLIDVSYNNVKSGLVALLCSQMKNLLKNLPKEAGQEKSSMKVGFITYNSSVHFYNISPHLGQPQMLVVSDVQEMFMPLLDGFLVDAQESENQIDALAQQIPQMFAETRETETILAPAIQAGLEALKASNTAGKLLVFHSSLPIYEAPGKLKNRDDRKLLGTEKEKSVLTPQNTVYNNLGQDCNSAGCSVDLFVMNNSFIDLPTIGQVSRLTGGEIYKYTYFQADMDGDRLITDIEKDIKRLRAFDSIMRVRTSTGIRPTDFYGHFFMSNTTDVEMASVDPDKAIAVEIKHDDKLSEEEGVYIQVALLYTSLAGQRRIRVLNLTLKASPQMTDLYRTCELDTIMNFLSKQAVFKLLEATPKGIKESLIHKAAQTLACYRKNCASSTTAGQLILPECMKLLPLYMNCLLKCDAISGGSDMTIDDRWFTMAAVATMDIPTSLVYLYPRLMCLTDGLNDEDSLTPVRCSVDKMASNKVYLLENGIYVFLWLGLEVPSDWVMSVFGVPSVAQVNPERNHLPVLDNPLSEKVRSVVESVRTSRHRTMRLTIVRQRDKIELVMKHFLAEDKGTDASPSYVDFLCHLHKEIRALTS